MLGQLGRWADRGGPRSRALPCRVIATLAAVALCLLYRDLPHARLSVMTLLGTGACWAFSLCQLPYYAN